MQRLPRGVIDVTHAVPFTDTEHKRSRRVRALPPVVAGKGREGEKKFSQPSTSNTGHEHRRTFHLMQPQQ